MQIHILSLIVIVVLISVALFVERLIENPKWRQTIMTLTIALGVIIILFSLLGHGNAVTLN